MPASPRTSRCRTAAWALLLSLCAGSLAPAQVISSPLPLLRRQLEDVNRQITFATPQAKAARDKAKASRQIYDKERKKVQADENRLARARRAHIAAKRNLQQTTRALEAAIAKKPDVVEAEEAVDKARTTHDAVREAIEQRLRSGEAYEKLVQQRRDAEAAMNALKEDPDADPKAQVQARVAFAQAKLEINRMIEEGLSRTPTFRQSRTAFEGALRHLAQLKDQHLQAAKQDPKRQAAEQAVTEAAEAEAAAEVALEDSEKVAAEARAALAADSALWNRHERDLRDLLRKRRNLINAITAAQSALVR